MNHVIPDFSLVTSVNSDRNFKIDRYDDEHYVQISNSTSIRFFEKIEAGNGVLFIIDQVLDDKTIGAHSRFGIGDEFISRFNGKGYDNKSSRLGSPALVLISCFSLSFIFRFKVLNEYFN